MWSCRQSRNVFNPWYVVTARHALLFWEKDAVYEQLLALQERLYKGDIVVGDLYAMVCSGNTLLGHVMGKRRVLVTVTIMMGSLWTSAASTTSLLMVHFSSTDTAISSVGFHLMHTF